MDSYVLILPSSYKAAVMLLKKKSELEAYRDDLIPSEGIGTIQVNHPKDISHLNQIAEDNNRLRPDDIAYASLDITGFAHSVWGAEKIAKEHVVKALKSVGIDKRFKYQVVV